MVALWWMLPLILPDTKQVLLIVLNCKCTHNRHAQQHLAAFATDTQEDKRLVELVEKYGAQNWTQIAQSLGGR